METCQLHQEMKEKMAELMENDRRTAEALGEIRDRLSSVESKASSAHHRLQDQKEEITMVNEKVDVIHRLVVAVERMQEDISKMVGTLDAHDQRLDAVERKGGDNASRILWSGGLTAVGIVVGYLINLVLS